MVNEFNIEILPDGRIKIDTDDFDPTVHTDAERIMKELEDKLGGVVEKKKKRKSKGFHKHKHKHGH